MKIGLLSYHNSINYGAVLQMFALKTALEELGADVSVIDYRAISSEYGSFSLKKRINDIGIVKALAKYFYYNFFAKSKVKLKKHRFEQFINKNFNLTQHFTSVNEFEAHNNFDIVICGSDQIWNPEITKVFDRMMFCDFQAKKTKKYSYAASVGDVKIIGDIENRKEFFNLIGNFDAIAVREKELAEFISSSSTINPLVTLDPTLLLDEKEYYKLEDTRIQQDKYILIYQLARYKKSREVAKQLAKEKNLKIVEIVNNPYTIKKNKLMLFNAAPSEFINLVKNAEYVITNSFHGTIFSIIFKKNFYTIASRTRNSRITNLLSTFELNDRLLAEDSKDFTRDIINYDKVDSLIKKEREISLSYLKDIVEREKNE